MIVNPVQQTPLAYDPARQVLSPPAPADVQAQQQPATAPIQQGDVPQDKFQPRDGGGGNQQNAGTSDQQKAALADQLHGAWLRLQQLQEEANEALLSGDASGARDAAQQAAQVAVTIQDATGSSPDVALGPIELEAQQISQRDASQDQSGPTSTSSGSSGSGSTSSSTGTGIDLARAGLGIASDVVDTAASIPSQPAPDRVSIDGYKRTVLAAIAGVEAIAARGQGSSTASSGTSNVIDIRA
ncbi:MAG TPA: hypothetical protein VGG27_13185 [Magnetospirillaceae bacterium]|jgi:hypothetical protein